MKNISNLIIAVMVMSATSCEVVELDQLNSTDEGTGQLTEEELTGPSTVPSTPEEILTFFHGGTSKSWDAEEFKIFGMSGFLSCRLDDTMIISADGNYAYDGGTSLCGAEDNAKEKDGTWALAENLTTLTFTEGSVSYNVELVGLTVDQITLRGNYQGLEVNGVYTSN